MHLIVAFLYISLFITAALAGKLPSEFKKCKHDDPNFSDCLKDAVLDSLEKLDDGIKSLNIPPLQPLNVPSITIGEGKGAVNVVQKYKNFNMYDMKTAEFQNFDAKITPNGLKIDVDVLWNEVRFEADYSFNGRILLLPIVGDGKCTVKLQKLKAKISFEFEDFDKKGIKYLKVKKISIKFDPGKVIYNFENLFNGDERLGAEMNKVLNDNWKEVYDDIGDQYATALEAVFTDYTNKIFSQIPYEELF